MDDAEFEQKRLCRRHRRAALRCCIPAVLLAGVTAGFRGVSLWGVSPVRTAMLLMCMAAGFLGGAGLGAAVGALTGLMLGVTSPAEPYFLCGLTLLGVLSGVFSRLGR